MPVRYEICVGLNKGHKTAKIKTPKYTGDKKVNGLRTSRMKNVSKLIFYSKKETEFIFFFFHMMKTYIHSQTD